MVLFVIAVWVALLIVYAFRFYNGCIKLRNQIEEAFSTMDVYLKQRYDLIPNLVNTVKGYAAHEEKTLIELTEARSKVMAAQTTAQRMEAETGFQSILGRLLTVAENYPELKANQNFLQLQQELRTQEDHIANSRKYYNAVVREFNTKIEKMPGALFAGMFGFSKQPLFEILNASQRENTNVQF